MTSGRRVAFVVPADIDDPARPSGGNEYDRRLAQGLRDCGWIVDLRPVAGPREVARVMAAVPDGCTVLVDGLLLAPAAETLVAHAARVRFVALMHMTMAVAPPEHGRPGAATAERSALDGAAAVITTSAWLRTQLVLHQFVDPTRVCVAVPGSDRAPAAMPSWSGNRLLCIAPVARHKGHDVLVAALARLTDLDWTCTCVGSLDRDADFAAAVRADAAGHGIADRIVFAGVHTRTELAGDYAASDLLVLPTRSESYGMVITEALARGLPVVASDVGGVVEAATGADGGGTDRASVPGALVPPDDPDALAERLRTWLTDAESRAAWRQRAAQRRLVVPGWDVTAARVARALDSAQTPGAP